MHTGRMPCEDDGIHQGDVPTSQRIPKVAEKPSENKRGTGQILLHRPQVVSTLLTP